MDTPKVLSRDEALQLVRDYKRVISPRFSPEPKVYMFGSYSKGYPNPWSDIDVAVIVPKIEGDWLEQSADLCGDVRKVSILIEPVLMEEPNGHYSPLYEDVMRTGIAV
ncbi:MAG: nucleotidyltransferase domain-containing protein [Bacteroidaceae bacterium]|nr:nucleotidyltransferase domain-containing protein [Bacteroidaceae bacterium]